MTISLLFMILSIFVHIAYCSGSPPQYSLSSAALPRLASPPSLLRRTPAFWQPEPPLVSLSCFYWPTGSTDLLDLVVYCVFRMRIVRLSYRRSLGHSYVAHNDRNTILIKGTYKVFELLITKMPE